ncbi:DUF4942 domain-containing protein [Vibrio owensii]|uniref:DUF4942 domain-containing protein n=1 Tax=Vibrio owensii TaxID=696485 RepID=UPI003AAD3741
MNAITQISTPSNRQDATSVSPLDAQATAQSDSSIVPNKSSTLAVVEALKKAGQDYEFYPTTKAHVDVITADIHAILKTHEFSSHYNETLKVLDIGAGDGRVLHMLKAALEANEQVQCELLAIEKASIHTNTYRSNGVTLLGTEFNEINFISKHADIAFVKSPYSDFSHWLSTLISQLNFKILYAIMPERWQDDPIIGQAMERRGIKTTTVLAESDFLDAHRQARAKVHIVRFAFNDFEQESSAFPDRRHYKPTIGLKGHDPFQIFIEDELGLKASYSSTTNKFYEFAEKERVRKAMQTEGTASYELVASRGLLWALLDNYERDLERVLMEYKKISALDTALLQELGVEYEGLRTGLKEKLFGFRHVYWSLLFDELDVLSSRLTSQNKQQLLNTLSANALDFTHTNATYIISYAVEMANELIESSLIEVFKALTCEKSIQRHYKSNEHMYQDNWRHHQDSPNDKARYLLDYRFVSSHWHNFSSSSWGASSGLVEDARRYCDDLMVAFKLIGYDHFTLDKAYQDMVAGDKLIIRGVGADGKEVELLHIRFYLNGNRHMKFNQDAMLRLNCTVSRLLGWVRSKAEFEQETESAKPLADVVWQVGDQLKVLPSAVFALADKRTA